jgi:transglutaminase-like putative cysteine protease
MAGLDWARTAPSARAQAPTILDKLPRGLIDWEFVLTLLLCLGAATAVSSALENGGWSDDMPPLTTVTLISVLSASIIARTRTSVFLAWPLGILLGAVVVVWQTLLLVGPGSVDHRIDMVHDRFDAWFHVAFGSGVSNDALPRDVLTLALTWLGVGLFGWSVFRWHNAWIGLVPGGAVLFLDLVLVGDNLTGTVVLYMLLGFLLVMQTNLLAKLKRWRAEGVEYPNLINVSFLHFSLWALIGLVTLGWLVPVGPYNTPAPVQAVIDRTLEYGTDFVRLAGPLHSKKVIPIHSYSGVLPFQGSISLGDRELMAVKITDPEVAGAMLLRGSVYDDYESGGWRTGERDSVRLPQDSTDALVSALAAQSDEERDGLVVPLHIEMLAKSVVGTVVFMPGEAIGLDRELTIDVPDYAISEQPVSDLVQSPMSDDDVYALTLSEGEIPVYVIRDRNNIPRTIGYLDLNANGLAEALEIEPESRIKRHRSYDVTGFIPNVTAEELREADRGTVPFAIQTEYLPLPSSVPERVKDLAAQVTGGSATSYDKAKDIEAYLRQLPVDYDVPDTPPGRDTVDYFLFDLRRGYFDYHASAMVVMLRSVNVPSRLAVGFAVDDEDYDPPTRSYIVRDRDSYAWPEVYFPDYGWIPFNPSPDRPEVIQPNEVDPASSFLDDPLGLDPRLRALLPISGADQAYFPPDVEPIPVGDSSGGGGGVIPGVGGSTGGSSWALLAVIAFGAAVFFAVSAGWQRSVAGLPYPQQVWEKTVRLASWGGRQPRPGQTPHEYVRALGRRHRGVRDLDVLARSYTRSRFGKKETDEAEKELIEEMWPTLRGALIGGIVARILHRKRHEG